jgi:undecaprenyl-diphosphatase
MDIEPDNEREQAGRGMIMAALYAIILGIIQGITEFLPVSSFGHDVLISDMLGMNRAGGLLLETMLHLGTLAAVFFMFRTDLVRIGKELVMMTLEAVSNLQILIHNRRTGDEMPYHRVISSTYRKLSAMLLVSFIPTAVLGFTARRLAEKAAFSPLSIGIGFLATGVFLLVADFSNSGGERTPKDAKFDHAMWIGIAQGLSVFPGISRCGLTICAALFCGFSRKFALKYSFLVSIPAVLGAFFSQISGFGSSGMTVFLGFSYILGMLAAGFVGCLTIRFLFSVLQKIKLRYFAVYCFLAGAATLLWKIL